MELILGSQSPRRRELLERMGLRFRVLTAEIDETKYETEDPVESVCRICRAKAYAVAQAFPLGGRCPSAHTGADEGASDDASALILTADTIVVLDGRIMGKPHDEAEARAMLRSLSGREHQVYTAFTLLPVAFPLGPTGRGPVGDFNVVAPATPAQLTSSSRRCPSAHTGADEGRPETGTAPDTHCEKTAVKFRELTEAEIAAYVATGEPMDKAGAYGIQNLGAMLVEAIRGDYFTVMGLPVCRLAQALKAIGLDPLLTQEKGI